MKRITYSKNIFLPVTNLCRNRCQYCSFRRNLDEAHLISRSAAQQLLEEGRDHGCSEALFTLGERPEEVEGFHLMLAGEGREDLLGYLVELCELAIEHDLL
ncbi:MAG TPA: 7,8-didemethyl-8-hydroxy-5-deazariboflavin synthase subunit CofG, partial [Methanothrix soehngenii]|nr:7,8-didemethyl-8-hydroxy-5-deazariboflavin synthase subunit CofG [Methanothrix soehngenii]